MGEELKSDAGLWVDPNPDLRSTESKNPEPDPWSKPVVIGLTVITSVAVVVVCIAGGSALAIPLFPVIMGATKFVLIAGGIATIGIAILEAETNFLGIKSFLAKTYHCLFGSAPSITKQASLPESTVLVEDTSSSSTREQDTYKKVVSLPVTEPGYVKVGFTPETAGTYGKVFIAPKDAQFLVVKGYMQEKQFIAEANQNEGQAHLLMKLANGKIFDVRQFLDEPMVIASATGLEFATTKENKLTKLTPGQVFVIEKDVFGVAQIMVGQMVQAQGNVETKALETSERVDLLTNKVSLSSAAPSKLPSSLLEIRPTADLQLCAGK